MTPEAIQDEADKLRARAKARLRELLDIKYSTDPEGQSVSILVDDIIACAVLEVTAIQVKTVLRV